MSNPLRLPVPLQNWSLQSIPEPQLEVETIILRAPSLSRTTQVTALSVSQGGQDYLDSLLREGVAEIQQKAIIEFGLQPIFDQKIRDAEVAQATKLSHALFEATDRAVSINQLRSIIRDIVAQFVADES